MDSGDWSEKKYYEYIWANLEHRFFSSFFQVIGYPCTILAFLLQFPLLYLHHSAEDSPATNPEEGGSGATTTATGTWTLREGGKLELSNEKPHDMKVIFHHGSTVHNTWQLTIAYQLLLVIALVGDVCIFRGLWVLLENSFLTRELIKP